MMLIHLESWTAFLPLVQFLVSLSLFLSLSLSLSLSSSPNNVLYAHIWKYIVMRRLRVVHLEDPQFLASIKYFSL